MRKRFPILILSLVCALSLGSCATAPQKGKAKERANKAFDELEKEEKKEPQTPEAEKKELEKELKKTGKEEMVPKHPKGEEKIAFPYTSEVIPFEEEGEGVASKYETQIEAEKRADEDALSKAMRKKEVDVYYGFIDVLAQYGKKDYQFVARYLHTWGSGIAVWDRVDKPRCLVVEDVIRCTVTIRGTIHSKGSPDPGYQIRLDEGNKKLGLDKEVYFQGDEVRVGLRPTRDSYIHLLCVDEENNVYLIYPNKYAEPSITRAGELFEFPGNSDLKLVAFLPEGRTECLELLHVIATKNRALFLPEDAKGTLSAGFNIFSLGELKEVTRRLAELDRDQWTMLVLPYSIRAR